MKEESMVEHPQRREACGFVDDVQCLVGHRNEPRTNIEI
jgi:hypothetical protein